MKYRMLGKSGIMVSEVTLGTVTFGGKGPVGGVDLANTKHLIDLAIEAGVNSFDTADNYSEGESEQYLGEALKGRREKFIITTKCGQRAGDGVNDRGLSRRHVIEQCENSLKSLQTDYIDVFMFHGWDELTSLDESLGAIDTLVQQGKIRSFGCSNFSASQLTETALAAGTMLSSHQIYYSMLGREAEFELFKVGERFGISNTIWSPLAQGLLTGKYRRGQEWPAGTRQNGDWNEPPIDDWEKVFDLVEVLVQAADGLGATPAEVALAWVIGRPEVTSVMLGAKNENQLNRNLAAVRLTLPDDALATLDQASRPVMPYPYWHQATQATRPAVEER